MIFISPFTFVFQNEKGQTRLLMFLLRSPWAIIEDMEHHHIHILFIQIQHLLYMFCRHHKCGYEALIRAVLQQSFAWNHCIIIAITDHCRRRLRYRYVICAKCNYICLCSPNYIVQYILLCDRTSAVVLQNSTIGGFAKMYSIFQVIWHQGISICATQTEYSVQESSKSPNDDVFVMEGRTRAFPEQHSGCDNVTPNMAALVLNSLILRWHLGPSYRLIGKDTAWLLRL